MGGTPSDKTNTTKSQRYANNKKGRTSSFFLYHRSKTSSSNTTKQPLQQQQSVVHNDSNDTVSPTFKMLEMEVITTTPTDSESDDFHRSISSMEGVGHHRTTTSVIEPHIATKVQFSTIEIRCYTITIGDHPCCTIGCPITLDWDYVSDDTINIDDYEQQKQIYITSTSQQQQNQHQHHRNDLRISPQDRMELLLYHASIQKDNSSNTNTTKLSEMEIRRASRKFHRTKLCSIKQNIRIHETFFHCPIDSDDNHEDDYEEDDDDTNSTDTNSTSDDDDEERDHPDIDIHDNVDAIATTKHRNLVCINQLHEV